jgi:hypothetical protein
MNRENLQKLADGLRQPLMARFHMGDYSQNDLAVRTQTCGSVGCAVGNATYIVGRKNINEGWGEYSGRLFDISDGSDEWEWCFSGAWAPTDDTPAGAADRIEILLNCGLPENWEEQMDGSAPLCYRQPKPLSIPGDENAPPSCGPDGCTP